MAIHVAAGASLVLGAVASCGARTGLMAEQETESGVAPVADGGPDAADAMPGIDVSVPDVPVHIACPDAAATFIYVIGLHNLLYSFDPTSGMFASIGVVRCPDPGTPFSMAVDREGVAYVVYDSGFLYRVSTKTAACVPTRYHPPTFGGSRLTFGMGFVADVADGGETLYVAEDRRTGSDDVLGAFDPANLRLTNIGRFHPTVKLAELTGTGGGRLYAFQPAPAFVFEVDASTAEVVAGDRLPGISGGGGWAFGFWGGSFYLFTGTGAGGTSEVHRFDPSTKTVTLVATLPTDTVVGAGVSTCAPQQ